MIVCRDKPKSLLLWESQYEDELKHLFLDQIKLYIMYLLNVFKKRNNMQVEQKAPVM